MRWPTDLWKICAPVTVVHSHVNICRLKNWVAGFNLRCNHKVNQFVSGAAKYDIFH